MPEVLISPAVTSHPSSRTRRKSIGRKRMHKPKSTLPTLDLDATAQMFLKVVVDEDSHDEDYVDELFTTLRQILHLVDHVPPGSTSHIPTASPDAPTDVPVATSAVPANDPTVPTIVPTYSPKVPAGASNKGKSPMIEEDIPVLARTFMQMEEDRLGEEAARRAQVEANASLSQTLLDNDVNEDNFPANMAALIKKKRQALAKQLFRERQNWPLTPAQQKAYM
nr:hypothetical protein [Tanacetum cinerariifolium]